MVTNELYLTRDVKSPPPGMFQNHSAPPTRLPTGPSLEASSPRPPQDNGLLGTLVQEDFLEHLDENPTWSITEDQMLRVKTTKLILSWLQRTQVQNQTGCGPSKISTGGPFLPLSAPGSSRRPRAQSHIAHSLPLTSCGHLPRASPLLSLIKTHLRFRASPRMQGDLLVSGSLTSAKVLFPNKVPLTGSGAHRGTWVYFAGGQHAPHDTPLLTAARRQEPPAARLLLMPPETGCQGTPPVLSPPRPQAPGFHSTWTLYAG